MGSAADHARASIFAKTLSGGNRYEKYLLGKKLRTDAMIVVVDGFVQEMNRLGVTKRKRPTYQGAALLYYLGFEEVFPYLSRDTPFPAKLEETYARLAEHDVNRAKTEAIISEALRDRLSK